MKDNTPFLIVFNVHFILSRYLCICKQTVQLNVCCETNVLSDHLHWHLVGVSCEANERFLVELRTLALYFLFCRNGILLFTVTLCCDSVIVHLLSLFVARVYWLKVQESLKVEARFGDSFGLQQQKARSINKIPVIFKIMVSSDYITFFLCRPVLMAYCTTELSNVCSALLWGVYALQLYYNIPQCGCGQTVLADSLITSCLDILSHLKNSCSSVFT